jgi:hypothetical protein
LRFLVRVAVVEVVPLRSLAVWFDALQVFAVVRFRVRVRVRVRVRDYLLRAKHYWDLNSG